MKKLDTEVKSPKVIQYCQNSKTNPGQLAAKPSFFLYNKQFFVPKSPWRVKGCRGETEEMDRV